MSILLYMCVPEEARRGFQILWSQRVVSHMTWVLGAKLCPLWEQQALLLSHLACPSKKEKKKEKKSLTSKFRF